MLVNIKEARLRFESKTARPSSGQTATPLDEAKKKLEETLAITEGAFGFLFSLNPRNVALRSIDFNLAKARTEDKKVSFEERNEAALTASEQVNNLLYEVCNQRIRAEGYPHSTDLTLILLCLLDSRRD